MKLWIRHPGKLLRDSPDYLELTFGDWALLLWAAFGSEAWVPEEPLRPRWLAVDREWRPGYVCNDDQGLQASVCHSLANGLELATALIPPETRDRAEREAANQMPAIQIPPLLRPGFLDAPYLVRPFVALRDHRVLRDRIPEVVAHLRRVPLDGGELVVFSDTGARTVDAV